LSDAQTKLCVTVICFALNYRGKHNRKTAIWGMKLTGKQPITIKITSTDTRFRYIYIAISELR